MINVSLFIKSYWEYFLELEEQFIETRRFVAFDNANSHTYSIEYLKLFQAVCSEIDVIGKEIASAFNSTFQITRTTGITNWGYEVQRAFPNLKNKVVIFNAEQQLTPFKNWEYEWGTSKDGRKRLKLTAGASTPKWWTNYNKVKHQRIGLITNTKNFSLANQKNLIFSLAALYLLEKSFIDYLNKNGENIAFDSKLFTTRQEHP